MKEEMLVDHDGGVTALAMGPTAITDGEPIGTDAEMNQLGRGLIVGALAANELVQLVGDWSEETHPREAAVQCKVDGIRCLYLGGDRPRLLTREGQPMDVARRCLVALRSMERAYGKPMMFDGEYQEPGGFQATQSAFQSRNGTPKGCLWLFDAVPLLLWQRNGGTAPLLERVATLTRIAEQEHRPNVGVLHSFSCDAPAATALAASMWRQGYEGLVAKDARAGYWRGNRTAWQRLVERSTTTGTVLAMDKRMVLTVEVPNGIELKVTVRGAAAQREAVRLEVSGQLIGARVDLAHKGTSRSGTPRHAELARFRLDLDRRV